MCQALEIQQCTKQPQISAPSMELIILTEKQNKTDEGDVGMSEKTREQHTSQTLNELPESCHGGPFIPLLSWQPVLSHFTYCNLVSFKGTKASPVLGISTGTCHAQHEVPPVCGSPLLSVRSSLWMGQQAEASASHSCNITLSSC